MTDTDEYPGTRNEFRLNLPRRLRPSFRALQRAEDHLWFGLILLLTWLWVGAFFAAL